MWRLVKLITKLLSLCSSGNILEMPELSSKIFPLNIKLDNYIHQIIIYLLVDWLYTSSMPMEWSIKNKEKKLKYWCILLVKIIKESLVQVILVPCYHSKAKNNPFFQGLASNSIDIFVDLFTAFKCQWLY